MCCEKFQFMVNIKPLHSKGKKKKERYTFRFCLVLANIEYDISRYVVWEAS